MNAIISMTTLPQRLPDIGPTVESLKAQGLPLYVWIPREVTRTGDKFDGNVPDFLDGCNVEVVEDKGPITKLLYALELGGDIDVVLTADDDVLYGTGPSIAVTEHEITAATSWAAGLLSYASRYPDTAFGYRGRVFTDRQYAHTRLVQGPSEPQQVHLITATWGAAYRPGFFEPSIFDEWQAYPMADDPTINAHLKRRDIARVVIPKLCRIDDLDIKRVDPLYIANDWEGGNDVALERVGWWDDDETSK